MQISRKANSTCVSSQKKFPLNIDLLVFDFDGVMTDNRVLVFEDGQEAVMCNRSDGLGIDMLKKSGVRVIVVSTEKNRVVAARCNKLGIEYHQGVDDKSEVVKSEAIKYGGTLEKTIYVGNDVNDLPAIEIVGYSIGVADSHHEILKNVDLILNSKGGNGAVREVADLILKAEKNE